MVSKINLSPLVASVAVRLKVVVLLLFIHCLFLFLVFGPCLLVSTLCPYYIVLVLQSTRNWSFDFYCLLDILKVAVIALCLSLAVPLAGMLCVVLAFTDRANLPFGKVHLGLHCVWYRYVTDISYCNTIAIMTGRKVRITRGVPKIMSSVLYFAEIVQFMHKTTSC